MADCAYSFKGIDGTLQTVTGIPALKAYLVDGGLEQLFPERKFPLKAVARYSRDGIGATINVDGVERPTSNSNGQLLHPTKEGIKNFWEWFGDSQVVDDSGRPLVVYHGTGGDFDAFELSKTGSRTDSGYHGKGFYFSQDKGYASAYTPTIKSGGNVVPAYLKIDNPYLKPTESTHGANWRDEVKTNNKKFGISDNSDSEEKTSRLTSKGFDGVILYKNSKTSSESPEGIYIFEAVAFAPTQIKSATGNQGSFSPANPDIRFSTQQTANSQNNYKSSSEAESAAENLFGPGIKNLTANGVLNFTQGYAAWPEAAQSQLQGGEEAVYYGGKIYVNLQAASKNRLAPVLLHEIGEHFNLELVLGVPGYKSLQDQITNRAKIVGSQAEKVWNQVAKLYPDLKVGSKEFVAEVIAKLGEIAPNAPWFRRILAKLKAFLIQRGLGRGFITGTLTENDMHDLLIASLRSAAKGFTKGEARLYGEGVMLPAFSFAGELSATADTHQLRDAVRRLAEGESVDSVRRETGWFTGVDGKWRFEIDDSNANLTPYFDAHLRGVKYGARKEKRVLSKRLKDLESAREKMFALEDKNSPQFDELFEAVSAIQSEVRDLEVAVYGSGFNFLRDVIQHDALFAAYPGLKNIRVRLSVDPEKPAGYAYGYFSPTKGEISLSAGSVASLESALLHEIQHGIQTIEGFASGGSPAQFAGTSAEYQKAAIAEVEAKLLDSRSRYLAATAAGDTDAKKQILKEREPLNIRLARLRTMDEDGLILDAYERLAGETEARNVQARKMFSADERASISPLDTQDRDDVTILYNGVKMASVPGWHGTPHEVERFRSDRIGTGEGAQAFGYGLYFTSGKRIAEWYRDRLTKDTPSYNTYKGERLTEDSIANLEKSDPVAHWVFNYMGKKATGTRHVPNEIDTLMLHHENEAYRFKKYGPEYAKDVARHEKIVAALKSVKEQTAHFAKEKNTGRLYQVELAPEQDEFLDWDKPLSDQSEKVKKALNSAYSRTRSKYLAQNVIDRNSKEAFDLAEQLTRLRQIDEAVDSERELSGKEAYLSMSSMFKSDAKSASDYLHSLGIRGIRYKAEGGKSDETNYVVFHEDDVNIVGRFSRTEKDEQFEKMGTVQDGETYEEAFWRDNNPSMMEILREKLEEATDKTKKILLAGLGVNHMIEIMANSMPGLKDLGKAIQARETAKMDIIREADNIVVDAKEKLTAPVRAKLNRVINESTDSDIDASLDWVGVEQPPTAGAPIFRAYSQARFTDYYKGLADQAAKALGARDGFKRNKAAFKDEAKAQEFVRTLADIEAKQSTNQNNGKLTKENQSRKAEHDKWNPMLTGLGKEAASLYRQMNDQHTHVMEDQLGEIIRRIEDAIADHRLRSQMIANVRLAFEDNSLQWYYAPLTRFGDYWYYGKDKNGKEWREHFTSEKALERTVQRFEKMGGEILGRGKALQNIEKFGSVGAADSYVADIQKRITDALDINDPVTTNLLDSIYQFHLSTLPDVSIRHSRQHRKGVKGAETDAFKSFSDKMHHASTQLANMKHGAEIAEVMSDHQEMKKLWENKRFLREAGAKVEAIEFLMDGWDTMAKPKVLERALKQAEADGDASKVDLYKQAISVRDRFGGALRDQLNTQGEVVGQMGGTSSDVQDGLERLYARTKKQVEGARKVMPKDKVLASDVIDELLKSVDAMMKTQTTDMDQLAMKLSALNFTGMMGFGISSALVNIVQTPGVAAPVIGARYGMSKTLTTLNKTASWFLKAVFNNMKDEDGNYSITEYLFAEQQKAEKTGDKAKVAELNGVIGALRQFKTDGTIGRTQTFDLLGVAENGLGTSSVFFDIAKKGGFMFHHAERFNREVTLAAAYLLSQNDTQRTPKQAGESDAAYKARLHESAVDYAHWANERAHLNYSAETAARIFRGPLARISMQFRKYTHGMLFLWAKSARDMLKPVKEENYPDKATFEAALEAKLEARRTLFGLLFMQTSFAGAMGLPMMGALGAVYGILAGDDDDIPADMERDLTAILIKWFGEDVGYAMARGWIDKFTPMALSSRLDLKDVFFREPLKSDELEGGEKVAAYTSQILGPTGGSAVKAGDAIGYLAKGEILKGAEKLLPKAVGDILKAYRLSTEGATTRQGDPIKEMSSMEVFLQGLGFGSSELNRYYTESGFAKAAEAGIGSARQSITSTQGRKMAAGDEIDMDRVDDWNEAHPEWPIHYADLVASAKRVSKNRETREEKGYLLNPKLEYLREEYDFFSDDEDED